MFGIFSEGDSINIEGELVLPAQIIINDYHEELYLPLAYWQFADYKESWKKSIEEGLDNKKHAALAVSMYDPHYTNFIFAWILYFLRGKVFLQNKVLFLDECPGFTPETINNFIELRSTHNENGMKISEWCTDLNSVLVFYDSIKS